MSDHRGLLTAHVKIGAKQTAKAIEHGEVDEVYIAQDADPRITSKIIGLCTKLSIQVTYVDTMKELGKACGIDVGAAVVAIVKQ
ncbi:large subunit ribosomal protein L7A [Paenibacillus shirakamiensis]|uniref:Large subunit ribosomal protein L7A n=1 Tax=Paenibacillus shirakamiensis TaxID=1265935 RepID=A0ABS4JLN8_9BACL|nr:ribosomal L7Ae/L30e/S12e/Gadd45 family protein [Paenibacillus shirakamiensis]MBP2002627.1 large subunit ribosomal protein L7A [Paenibacillus shirakamiensis]